MEGIDLVIPMVFPDDPEWRASYLRHAGSPDGTERNVRFRSWGTEELLVLCALRFMPWLRRIHLLLASESQVRPWMVRLMEAQSSAGGPDVCVVLHRDFIPEEYLPCFCSPCFEMFLGSIPGLAGRFIYGNDDMFPLSPLSEQDFFAGGLPVQHVFEKALPRNPNLFQRKCLWQQNMVARPFGRRFSSVLLKNGHSFAPILKDSCREVWRRHGDDISRHLSPTRRTDRSANHYVYVLYQHFAGLEAPGVPRRQMAGPTVATDMLPSIIRDKAAGIVCLNDNEDIADWRGRAAVARREIAMKLGLDGYEPDK